MTDPNEIPALKAAWRGALQTARALEEIASRVETLDNREDIGNDELETLGRITAAHAIASAALRGLVNTMRARRGLDAHSSASSES